MPSHENKKPVSEAYFKMLVEERGTAWAKRFFVIAHPAHEDE